MSQGKNTAVLAYSGGLDSTISIDWIKKNYWQSQIPITEDNKINNVALLCYLILYTQSIYQLEDYIFYLQDNKQYKIPAKLEKY